MSSLGEPPEYEPNRLEKLIDQVDDMILSDWFYYLVLVIFIVAAFVAIIYPMHAAIPSRP